MREKYRFTSEEALRDPGAQNTIHAVIFSLAVKKIYRIVFLYYLLYIEAFYVTVA